MRGVLVAFEGIDGSGKSTQARRVAAARGALFTFEPGDTELGAELRQTLLHSSTPLSPATEALLMLADRSAHVHQVIAPALVAGSSVVTDRFVGSTLAYQGYGRGVDLDLLAAATQLAVGDVRADVTILLDVPVSVARDRGAADRRDRFESAGDEFLDRVRHGFLAQADADPTRWRVLDGTRELQEVTRAVDAVLDEFGVGRG